ncbi:uncharacterized protein LOC120191133 [Hibiscus syriacus]|uniref:uncharacterized protein LOC120191133 n=1 Tax=Hibiscus syriacus TaxID=106335 RepID=UPI0019212600|nr:uncharacterized protein LOC120191133 [Hibiscus syriacus]
MDLSDVRFVKGTRFPLSRLLDKSNSPSDYLGIPLSADPRRVATWDPVIEKCKVKLASWKSRALSFAGRVVLINSVLSTLPLYYMSIFSAPKAVISKIDYIKRGFLRGVEGNKRRLSRVNWGRLCIPKKHGGAGVINLRVKNKALLAKWGWRYATERNALWRSIICHKYGSGELPWMVNLGNIKDASITWKGIISNLQSEETEKWMCGNSFRWQVGDGKIVLFWEDVWYGDKALRSRYPRLYRLVSRKFISVDEMFSADEWLSQDLPALFNRQLLDRERVIVHRIKGEVDRIKIISYVPDRILWVHENDGIFKVKKLSELLMCNGNFEDADLFCYDKIWRLKIPPKKKMRTICLCPAFSWDVFGMHSADGGKVSTVVAWHVSFAAALWSLWLARNEFVFRDKGTIIKDIILFVKMRAFAWCKALKVFEVLDEKRWWDSPGDAAISSEANRILKTVWQPPKFGQMKFNVDGSATKDVAGCGGVLRTAEGYVVAMFFGPVAEINSDFAELSAIKKALEVFSESLWCGKVDLILESDSTVALNWVQNYYVRPWRWGSTFQQFDEDALKIREVKYVFTPRLSNGMADYLAKLGSRRAVMFAACW